MVWTFQCGIKRIRCRRVGICGRCHGAAPGASGGRVLARFGSACVSDAGDCQRVEGRAPCPAGWHSVRRVVCLGCPKRANLRADCNDVRCVGLGRGAGARLDRRALVGAKFAVPVALCDGCDADGQRTSVVRSWTSGIRRVLLSGAARSVTRRSAERACSMGGLVGLDGRVRHSVDCVVWCARSACGAWNSGSAQRRTAWCQQRCSGRIGTSAYWIVRME